MDVASAEVNHVSRVSTTLVHVCLMVDADVCSTIGIRANLEVIGSVGRVQAVS